MKSSERMHQKGKEDMSTSDTSSMKTKVMITTIAALVFALLVVPSAFAADKQVYTTDDAKAIQTANSGADKAMYRLYNPNSGEHFYTASTAERDKVKKAGWRYEGIGWYAPTKSSTPVYRLYNPNAGDHHYTTSVKERDNVVKAGWRYEGIGWYSSDKKEVPMYREYNPNAYKRKGGSGAHNYTTSLVEHKNVVKAGWKDEGTGAWYGTKPGTPVATTSGSSSTSAKKYYTVTYVDSVTGKTLATRKVAEGERTPKLKESGLPKHEGYLYPPGQITTINYDVSVSDEAVVTINYKKIERVITYNPNGGTGTMSKQETNVSGVLSKNQFTRSGYVFKGWNTKADGTGRAYEDEQYVWKYEDGTLPGGWNPGWEPGKYLPLGSVTLYAQWGPPTVTLHREIKCATCGKVIGYGYASDLYKSPLENKYHPYSMVLGGNTSIQGAAWNKTCVVRTGIHPHSYPKQAFGKWVDSATVDRWIEDQMAAKTSGTKLLLSSSYSLPGSGLTVEKSDFVKAK